MKNQSIDLFSRTGMTIVGAIALPIFTVVILGTHFPKTWDSMIASLGLARGSNSRAVTSVPVGQGIEIPAIEPCNRSYVSVKMDTFSQCLIDGMSYNQVVSVLGYPGTLTASSGSAETWQWNDGQGKYLSAVFINGRLVSKAQAGLD